MWKTFNHNQDLHHMVRNYSLKLEKYHDGRNIRKTQCLTNIIKTCLILASYIVKISFSWYHPLSCRTISVLHIAYLRLIWIGTYLLPVLGCKLLEHRMYKLVSVSNLSASAVVLRRTTELCPSILQKLFAVLHSTELFVYFLFICPHDNCFTVGWCIEITAVFSEGVSLNYPRCCNDFKVRLFISFWLYIFIYFIRFDFVLSCCLLDIFVVVGVRTESDFFLFLWIIKQKTYISYLSTTTTKTWILGLQLKQTTTLKPD